MRRLFFVPIIAVVSLLVLFIFGLFFSNSFQKWFVDRFTAKKIETAIPSTVLKKGEIAVLPGVDIPEIIKQKIKSVKREKYREYVVEENGSIRTVSVTGEILDILRNQVVSDIEKAVLINVRAGENNLRYIFSEDSITVIDNRTGKLAGMTFPELLKLYPYVGLILSCNIVNRGMSPADEFICGSLILRDKYML